MASQADHVSAPQAVARGLGIQLNKNPRPQNVARAVSRLYHRWAGEQRPALQQEKLSKARMEMPKSNSTSVDVQKSAAQRDRTWAVSASTEETGAGGSGDVDGLQDRTCTQGHLRQQFLSYLLERMKQAEAAVEYAVKVQEEQQRCHAVKVRQAQTQAQHQRQRAFEAARIAAQQLQQARSVRKAAASAVITRRTSSAVADAEQAAQDAVLKASEADAQAAAAAEAAETMVRAKEEQDARLQRRVEDAEARATMATQAWWEAGLKARRLGALARAPKQAVDAIAARRENQWGEPDFGARSRSPSSSTSYLPLCSPVTSEMQHQHQSWSLSSDTQRARLKSAEERGSGARARVGRAEAPEGGGGACMLSPATAEHPGAGPGRASTGNGADARGGEERDSRSRVGRGRPGRNVVAGHVVDVERLASLVMSMGGALSVTAKRRWRVCPSLRPPPVAKAMAWTLSL